MRTLISLSPEVLKALKEICERENISQAEAIRRAIETYVTFKRKEWFVQTEGAFGIWASRKIDAVQYVKKLRKEWERK